MKRTVVDTDRAPAAVGPYSQAIIAGDYIFTAGQLPLDPSSGQLISGDITAQTEQVIKNLEAILTAAGSSLELVVKTTVFLTNLHDFAALNQVYARFFPSLPPARSTVQVAALPKGAAVEIEAVAILPEKD